jgi:CRP-like cAMP-binding protein
MHASKPLRGIRVLIVLVDVVANGSSPLAPLLAAEGADVMTAMSLAHALQVAARTAPEVIISNSHTAQAHGEELVLGLRAVARRTGARMPTLALAGAPDERAHVLAVGFTDCLPEPLDPFGLVRAITRLLGRPNTALENRILVALVPGERARLLPHLRPITFAQGDVLHEAGEPVASVYFPLTAVVALLATTEDGASVEAALVGSEGVVGVEVCLGAAAATSQALVHVGGSFLRLPATLVHAEYGHCGAFKEHLHRYVGALWMQSMQAALCNRLHPLTAQLSRWLLLMQDRIGNDELPFTHEFLARIHGARRRSVTVAAKKLQGRGFIRYRYGHVAIVDRRGLEASACACYGVQKAELERLASS